MNIITIKTPQSLLQTSFDTISKNAILLSKLDPITNLIEVDIECKNMRIILNYLRGYSFADKKRECGFVTFSFADKKRECDEAREDRIQGIPLSVAYDAFRLGIEFKNYVVINVGGKLYYLPRKLLTTRLEYFIPFFSFNKHLDRDFSSVLIDRCPMKFNQIIDYVKCYSIQSYDYIEEDLGFYGHNNSTSSFIDLKPFSFCKKSYSGLFMMENIEPTITDDSNTFIIDATNRSKYFLCQFRNPPKEKSIGKFVRISQNMDMLDLALLIAKDECSYNQNVLLIGLSGHSTLTIRIDKSLNISCAKILKDDSLKSSMVKKYYKVEYGSGENIIDKIVLRLNDIISPSDSFVVFKDLYFHPGPNKLSHFVLK